ncbi:MAG: Ni/Fe hydrogenase subunit alpha [Alphaproteobacteria bacterium]|nr:Ni/Fe hydrogenase subunit alpha [Alphaproteobacteria bacterium]
MNDKTRTIKVDYLARVEGEGAMYLKIEGNTLKDVQLKIFEPPRFFEGFLQGRDHTEVPDITARICGICPVAHQLSSVYAVENALGIKLEGPLHDLRRLIYCGEWITSHALHIYMLHAPDFLGYESALHMAADYPNEVQRGLQLKKVGGQLQTFLGGRNIHPVSVRVGGFHKIPSKEELLTLKEPLERAREASLKTVRWVSTFDFPDFEQDYTFVAVHHPDEYAINEGDIASSDGTDIEAEKFEQYIEEHQAKHTNAIQCVIRATQKPYQVGPLARYSLNFDKLPPHIQALAKEVGLGETCSNPFKSIIVRSIETLYACEEALRIIDNYVKPEKPFVKYELKAATGCAVSEAPRGLLFHRYTMNEKGDIEKANIIPPTAQNQKMIEDDLWKFVQKYLDLPDEKLQWQAEHAIRNYDPCISCSVHFLKLTVDRI